MVSSGRWHAAVNVIERAACFDSRLPLPGAVCAWGRLRSILVRWKSDRSIGICSASGTRDLTC